jgi:hypothetical protein
MQPILVVGHEIKGVSTEQLIDSINKIIIALGWVTSMEQTMFLLV